MIDWYVRPGLNNAAGARGRSAAVGRVRAESCVWDRGPRRHSVECWAAVRHVRRWASTSPYGHARASPCAMWQVQCTTLRKRLATDYLTHSSELRNILRNEDETSLTWPRESETCPGLIVEIFIGWFERPSGLFCNRYICDASSQAFRCLVYL